MLLIFVRSINYTIHAIYYGGDMVKVNICSSRNLMKFLSEEEGYGLLEEVKIDNIYDYNDDVEMVAFDKSGDTVLVLRMSLEELTLAFIKNTTPVNSLTVHIN